MRISPMALTIAIAGVLALAGCNRKEKAPQPAPPPTPAPAPLATPIPDGPKPVAGFAHEAAFDAAGYYQTAQPVTVGDYQLTHVGLGAPSDFKQWERGDRASTFGPILFQFEDVTSPMQVGETGAESHKVSLRVLPDSYQMSRNTIRFRGHDPKLGEVVFDGRFDTAALARAKTDGASERPVLTGDLKIGSGAPQKVAFGYWVGD